MLLSSTRSALPDHGSSLDYKEEMAETIQKENWVPEDVSLGTLIDKSIAEARERFKLFVRPKDVRYYLKAFFPLNTPLGELIRSSTISTGSLDVSVLVPGRLQEEVNVALRKIIYGEGQ